MREKWRENIVSECLIGRRRWKKKLMGPKCFLLGKVGLKHPNATQLQRACFSWFALSFPLLSFSALSYFVTQLFHFFFLLQIFVLFYTFHFFFNYFFWLCIICFVLVFWFIYVFFFFFSNLLLFLYSRGMKINLFKLHFLSLHVSTPKSNAMREN